MLHFENDYNKGAHPELLMPLLKLMIKVYRDMGQIVTVNKRQIKFEKFVPVHKLKLSF